MIAKFPKKLEDFHVRQARRAAAAKRADSRRRAAYSRRWRRAAKGFAPLQPRARRSKPQTVVIADRKWADLEVFLEAQFMVGSCARALMEIALDER